MLKTKSISPAFRAIIGLLILTALIVLPGCDFLPAEATITPTLTATQTETPTPTVDWFPATATPTQVPLPSPTPQPTLEDLRTGLVDLIVEDDFTDQSLWETRQSSVGNIAFGNQNLSLAIASASTSLTSLSQHTLPEDFYMEITIQPTLCQPTDQSGLLFLYLSAGDYHRLLIDCAGQVRLELIQGGQSYVLQNWETARLAQPGPLGANRLGLWVSNGQLQLYINDVLQFNRSITANRSGGLGVFARTVDGSTMTVRFSDLQVFSIQE